ncbi:ARM repeat-containing protein [Amylocystis lapponica]|nr:ARM repeat-containing protein [Amylocystis lapponica]
MDVPFISSGAMSRAHYALVRKIETAQSPQLVDQILLAEVDSIRNHLALTASTVKQLKERLTLLLYCSMTVNPGVEVDLDFALHHAINLAETGLTVQDKRIGYLFCAEIMPPSHELQLMLVNTLRKDLESDAVSRICLALDALIQFSSEDVIPAIQSRLVDLLSHNSFHIRRRALLAFHKLGAYDSRILEHIVNKTHKRLGDTEHAVVSAALTVNLDLVNAQHLSADKLHTSVIKVLRTIWKNKFEPNKRWLLVRCLSMLRITMNKASVDDLRLVLDIVRTSYHVGPSMYAPLYQCFLSVSVSSPQLLLSAQEGSGTGFVQDIRRLLTTEDPNDIYLFVACLECLEPSLWAGTTTEIPAVLEGWEVERIMKLLDSPDAGIRKKTLRILKRVDLTIVEGYYAKLIHGGLSSGVSPDSEEVPRRTLEIIEVICAEDGELYAHYVKDMLSSMEGDASLDKRQLIQEVVEEVLVHMRNGSTTFRSGFIGALFASIVDLDSEIGPTLMVILAALISEYLYMSPMSPIDLLRGLSLRLAHYSVSIQDACLLSMIRITVDCDEVPSEVIEKVNGIHDRGGRHIRRRCDQFLDLLKSRDRLKYIVSKAKSSALPDFLAALEIGESENYDGARHASSSKPARSLSPSTSHRDSPTPSKLRYAAYDPPKPVSRLRRLSSSSSRQSDDGTSKFVGQGRGSMDSMSRTLTPGNLALLAGRSDMQTISTGSSHASTPPVPVVQISHEDDSTSHVDLIALDSPFVAEPQAAPLTASSVVEPDIKSVWDSLEKHNLRGWCELPIDAVVRRLQGMQLQLRVTAADQAPFEGDLKILISRKTTDIGGTAAVALLRLRESEDESCLWRMRCEDSGLRMAIKTLIAES